MATMPSASAPPMPTERMKRPSVVGRAASSFCSVSERKAMSMTLASGPADAVAKALVHPGLARPEGAIREARQDEVERAAQHVEEEILMRGAGGDLAGAHQLGEARDRDQRR